MLGIGDIPLNVLVVNFVFITALNVAILISLEGKNYAPLIGFTALPWILVPIMGVMSEYTMANGAFLALAWDVFLLWPTYFVLLVYGVYRAVSGFVPHILSEYTSETN